MSRFRQLAMITVCAAAVAGGLSVRFVQGQAAAVKAARPIATLQSELDATAAKIKEIVQTPHAYGDAKFRGENAQALIPLLHRMADLLQESERDQGIASAKQARVQSLMLAAALGDKASTETLQSAAASTDATEALGAKSALALANWVLASEDAKAQQKILDGYAAVAKESAGEVAALTDASGKIDPADQKKMAEAKAALVQALARQDVVAETLFMMWDLGAANDDMSKKALAVIKTLNSDAAKRDVLRAEAMLSQRNLVGRPIRIRGRTTTNAVFDTNDHRGKVILVDFWATWCPPCRESVPFIKKIYAEYHDKGLEVVGVDSDVSDDLVTAFTKKNEMPWPQLREATQTDDDNEHPLAKRYGVDRIPSVFLIDRKGNLRHIDGDEDTERKIKKLLEEPDPRAPKPAPAAAPGATPAPAAPPAPAAAPAPAAKPAPAPAPAK